MTKLEQGAHGCERGIEISAQEAQACDEGDADKRRNEGVFDGGGAGFVLCKIFQHHLLPRVPLASVAICRNENSAIAPRLG